MKLTEHFHTLIFGVAITGAVAFALVTPKNSLPEEDIQNTSETKALERCDLNTSMNERSTLACMRENGDLGAKFVTNAPKEEVEG